jgi:membrane-bound lytic murein transglycosylase D
MLERKNYYFPIFEYYLRKHNMPDALKYLSIVESGLNYRAKSRTGALGLWQFMPGTGKDFYLAQNQHIDERQNPYLATEAACKFLKYLYGMFNDWELALAAYNCGPGNVMKAMRKSGKRGFWEIYNFLPKETRSYVPQFHAVVYSMHYASAHNIFPDVDSVLTTAPLDTFRTNKAFDICKLEQILGLPNQCLLLHNPDLKTNIFPANCAQPLLVPITHSSPLALNLDVFLDSAKVNWGRVNTSRISSSKGDGSFKWIWVPKGSHPSRLAKKHGVDVQTLCQLNHIKNSPIKKGKRLRFPTESQFAEPVVVKNQESKKEIAPVESKEALQEFLPEGFHRVKKAEKLYQLAIQYGSSTRQIREWNSLTSSRIHEGQILRVVPGPSTACIDTIPVTEGCSESTAPAHYRVKRGDRLFQIAKSHGLTMAQLLAANPEISSELKAGQLLNIPSINQKADPHADLALNLKSSKTKSKPKNAEEVFSKTYRVQKGDTLYSITRKFNRLTIKDLMRLNNPGQQLIVG